jgi:hypothetical protein
MKKNCFILFVKNKHIIFILLMNGNEKAKEKKNSKEAEINMRFLSE